MPRRPAPPPPTPTDAPEGVSSGDTSATPDIVDTVTDADLVRETLRDVCRNPNNQASARAQAARTLAELSGIIGQHSQPPADTSRPVGDLSRADLEAELEALRQG